MGKSIRTETPKYAQTLPSRGINWVAAYALLAVATVVGAMVVGVLLGLAS